MAAKTKLVDGVRVNIADNTVATPSSSNQADQMAEFGLEPGSAITSDTLTPETPFDLTEATPPADEVTGTLGFLDSQADSFSKQLEQDFAKTQKAEETSLEKLARTELGQLTEEEALVQAEEAQGIPELRGELADIDAQILAEKRALENTIRDIEDKGGGLVSGQNIDIRRAQNESLRRRADLSVVRLGLQGKFDAAQATATRAINAIISRQKKELGVAEKIYDRNKGLFDKAEQRLFETRLSDRNRELDKEEERLKDIQSIGLMYLQEGGDATTAQNIMKSDSVEEAVGKTGNVIGMTARLQRQKLIDAINDTGTDVLQGADKFDAEVKLSKDYNSRTGDYNKAATQIGNIRASYQSALDAAEKGESINAASQGVLVAFQKLLDPTSVVRESEYARSGQGLSLVSQIEGQVSQLKQGGAGVTAQDLKEFADTAETFLRGYEDYAIDQAQLTINTSSEYGLNTNNIIPQNVFNLMEDRFEQGYDTANTGDTFQVGGYVYQKNEDGSVTQIQ